MTVHLHTLATEGHREATFDDTAPEERAALAMEVSQLMQNGYACFLRQNGQDFKILGYDLINSRWRLAPRRGASEETAIVAESEVTVTAVPAIAGG